MTVVVLATSKESGSAPKDRMLPRFCADSWSKLPEISALAPRVWATEGAETTLPSSTIANWFIGGCCCESLPVIDWNFFVPPPVKSIWTIHMPRCWSSTPFALATSVPSSSAGPRMYLSQFLPVVSWPQATIVSLGPLLWLTVVRDASSRQSSAVNFFSRAAVAGSGGVVAAGSGGVVAAGARHWHRGWGWASAPS